MNSLPSSIKQVAFFLERLPGIGKKTANRLAFYFLRMPQKDLEDFARHLISLKQKTKLCRICLNLTEDEVCPICADRRRDHSVITVVEEVLDIISFEMGNIYQGVYHVLHGRIDPLNRIGPEDIHINELIAKVKSQKAQIREIILATNADMEGEATAMYIRDRLKEQEEYKEKKFKISRLGYGLPIGADLEYADYMTLSKAIENRSDY